MGKNAQSKGRSSAPSRGTGCEYTMPYLSPGLPLYGLAFNFRDPRFSSLLAAAGKQGASVFCLAMETKASDADFLPGKEEDAASGSRGCLPCEKLLPVMTFKDEDEREDYYSCAWASGEEGEPLLVVGGFCGIVKVLDVSTGKLRQVGGSLTISCVVKTLSELLRFCEFLTISPTRRTTNLRRRSVATAIVSTR